MSQSEDDDTDWMSENFPRSYGAKGKWRASTLLIHIHEHQTKSESEVESDVETDMLRDAIALSKETSTYDGLISTAGPSITIDHNQNIDSTQSKCPISGTNDSFLYLRSLLTQYAKVDLRKEENPSHQPSEAFVEENTVNKLK